MQNKDHYLLGCFILKRYGACIEPICQKLFLLGCVEPDWNLVTYTRGSIKHRFLHGHNAENVQKHLTHMTERLMKTGVHTPLQWFYFGAALHYLADSFTFAHNRIFTGSIIDTANTRRCCTRILPSICKRTAMIFLLPKKSAMKDICSTAAHIKRTADISSERL